MKRILALFTALLMLFSIIPLSTPAVFTGEDKIVIVIDPGHGGPNVGTAHNGIGEKIKTMELGLALKARLEANGNFIVHMTRESEIGYDMTIGQRGVYGNTVNCDLLVSLHFDGSTNTGDRGVSVITSVLPEYAMTQLGNMIGNNLVSSLGFSSTRILQRYDNQGYYWNAEKQWDCQDPSLGELSDYYGIPTWGAKFGYPTVLIEHGYFTNYYDQQIIFADGAIEKMADADAQAIIDYYTNHTHTYGAATQDFPSNCMFTGKTSEKCTVCGHRRNIQSLEPAPNNHYWVNEYTQPTKCGEDGYTYHECRITMNLNEKGIECQNHTETVYYTAEPHDYQVTASAAVTHTTDGYSTYTCTKCKASYTVYEYAKGHTWQLSEEIAPTCTANGVTKYTCTECNGVKEDKVDPLGHSEYLTTNNAPTCTEPGYKEGYCTACKAEIAEDIPATGHTMTEEIILAATCTEGGTSKNTCTACGYSEEAATGPVGHTYTDLSNACTACGYTTDETTAAQTEKETAETKAPTVTAGIETEAIEEDNNENGLQSALIVGVLFSVSAILALILILIRRRGEKTPPNEPSEDTPDSADDDTTETPDGETSLDDFAAAAIAAVSDDEPEESDEEKEEDPKPEEVEV